jgi:diaminopimelate decarboxylase
MGLSIHERVLQAAIESGFLDEDRPLAAFVDTQAVNDTIRSLKEAFPPHFEHMFAAKANTMRRALELVKSAGMGCEVASPGELEQALRTGFRPQDIVFDEPAKTPAALRKVFEAGVNLNIDNFQEFSRVKKLREASGHDMDIGFRINPQVGWGSIGAMSTATPSSKFGIPLDDEGNREAIIACYRDNPWLNSLHTHVGSQGCALELMAEGVGKVTTLAEEINSLAGDQQVRSIDIGGGLPVNFESDDVTPTFADYAGALRERAPQLFSGQYRVKTEFGRSILAKSGFIAARVEYTKNSGGRQIAISHAGAHVAARTIFMPDHWKIRISAFGPDGLAKTGEPVSQDIAGPCCFAGDMAGTDRLLPLIEAGDVVVLHDTGAYYFSNPFIYNALPAPAVYGAGLDRDGSVRLDCWRRQQSMDDMLAVIG